MTKDNVDFVRQGAFIALAMILTQQNEALNSKSATVRTMYEEVIKKKNEDALAKFGAVLGQGIIDAGKHLKTIPIRLLTPNFYSLPKSSIYPHRHHWRELGPQYPEIEFTSNARPSLFAYIPPTKPPTTTVIEKVATVVLSTTVKAQAKAKKAKPVEAKAMEEDEKSDEKTEEVKDDETKAAAKPKKEPQFEKLGNLARVLPAQLKYITFDKESRYVPVRK
ncbi:proteasome regulatory particle base subunit, partial [Mortierella sp. AD094]